MATKLIVNEDITNPDLVTAIYQLLDNNNATTQNELIFELNRANYLMVVLNKISSKALIEENTISMVLLYQTKDGNIFLPLFTDWEEINKYVKDANTVTLPAKLAWEWVLENEYDGCVINPAKTALQIRKELIKNLSNMEIHRTNK